MDFAALAVAAFVAMIFPVLWSRPGVEVSQSSGHKILFLLGNLQLRSELLHPAARDATNIENDGQHLGF